MCRVVAVGVGGWWWMTEEGDGKVVVVSEVS